MSTRSEGLDILYVGTLPPHNGGTAIVGDQLLTGLSRLGHRIRAIAPITSETRDAGEDFSKRHPDIAVTRYEVPFFYVASSQARAAEFLRIEGAAVIRCASAAISERHPDLLIIGRETFLSHLPDLAKSHSIPALAIVQSGHFFGLADLPASRARLAEQLGKVDCIVSVSNHQQDMIRKLGLPTPITIQNPVNLTTFRPRPGSPHLARQLRLTPDDLVIAHISNLKDIKRASDIVTSARDVIQAEPHATYIMVGDGPCRAELEAECRALGIIDHFRFTGWVDHDKVADYINLADAVVMASEIEAMALIYLETMACGRLLIASDIPAAREAVGDDETGLLFRMGDIQDLTRKILLAANDRALRERIGGTAREWVKQHDLRRFVAAYDETIRSLATMHHPTGHP